MRIIAYLFILISAGQLLAGEPRWPLKQNTKYLTSNFMEYRRGRFHAGLDMKTGSVTGIPVIASESGWVSRIKTSHAGYGKVIYIKGFSGRTFVYAHLDQLADKFMPTVLAARESSGEYSVSLLFGPKDFLVSSGEVIGLSGQSGTDGPHLHFEVRDNNQRPLNPQLQGFPVNDTIAPEILSISVIPTSPETLIEGVNEAFAISSSKIEDKCSDLYISGPVAFTAKVIERSDIKNHALEPCHLELFLDGKTVYKSDNKRFNFDDIWMMKLEWLNQPGKRERWLYTRENNKLEGRAGINWGNNIADGKRSLLLIATDASGNKSQLSWNIISGQDRGAGNCEWEQSSVSVVLPDGSGKLSPFLKYDNKGEIVRLNSKHFVFPDSILSEQEHSASQRQGLLFKGKVIEVIAADWPYKDPQFISGDFNNSECNAIYRYSNQNEWQFLSQPNDDGFYVIRPGKYALFEDVQPPDIDAEKHHVMVVKNDKSICSEVTLPKWRRIPISVIDYGSGIKVDSMKMTLDDKQIIPEPDMPRHRFLVTLPDTLSSGEHTLKMSVIDNAGLVAEKTILLTNSSSVVD